MEDEGSSASVTVTRTEEEGSHQLIVENYSIRKRGIGVNQSIDSDQFTVGGYQWAIRFFPKGKTDDAYVEGCTSLFLSLKSNINHTVPCIFEIHLLDQSGKGNHLGRYLFNKFPPYITYASSPRLEGLLYFIKRKSLEDKHSNYLKDDRLIINCTIRVLNSHILKLPLKEVPESNIGTDLGKLLEIESKKNPDIFFVVAGERFRAHKAILAAHAAGLKSAVLLHPLIVIPDMEPRVFKALLWFIYTTTLLEEEQEALDDPREFIFESFMGKMLSAADRFGLKRLKEIYESRILESLSVESVGYLLHLAERCHATNLKDACLRFAAENQAAVMESNGVGYLKEACPLLFLELAGCTEKPSTSREVELDFCTKMVSVVKESVGGMFSPYAYKKLKEV